MTERLVTLKLTYEEMRLLYDSFSMSFMHDNVDPGTAKLEAIANKMSDAMHRKREKD